MSQCWQGKRVSLSQSNLNKRLAARRTKDGGPPIDHVARINGISTAAKTSWFGLMSYLAFVGVTLLGVQDADFFIPERETALPLIGVTIPTLTFFWTAPALGALLYAYLHIYLVRLWDYLADAPDRIDGVPLADAIAPWIMSDWALKRRTFRIVRSRPLGRLGSIAAISFSFLSAPIILGLMWYMSMVRHDFWLTTVGCGLPLSIVLYSGFRSWYAATGMLSERLLGPLKERPIWLLWGLPVILSTIGWFTTIGELEILMVDEVVEGEVSLDQRRVLIGTDWLLPSARLAGERFELVPDAWLPERSARREFEVDWCRQYDIPQPICPGSPFSAFGPARQLMIKQWCARILESNPLAASETCGDLFESAQSELTASYSDLRKHQLRGLPTRNLSDLDLRNANLRSARLSRVDFSRSKLKGADLSSTVLQGAIFNEADLRNVDLSNAEMRGAILFRAKLQGADLSGSALQGANFYSASLDENTILVGANLSGAGFGNNSASQMEALRPYWNDIFADGSVLITGEDRPTHWPVDRLTWDDFLVQWLAWQETRPDFDPSWRRE